MVAVANPLESFIWGAGGAQKTPEQVAREREIAAALMKGGVDYSPVDHWMQGAARAAQAGVGAFKDWRADNAEETGRAGFQSQWDSIFGGSPTQTALIDPVAQALTATDAVNSVGGGRDFLNSLISNESGGNWAAQNDAVGSGGQVGHFGRLQFGQARLQDAMDAGVIPAGTTPEQFMADPAAQQAVEAWHFADIDQQAANLGLNKYIGQTIGGAQITPEAIRAMAHLGGIGGAQKFLESGGQYNPSDANGTSLLDYAQNHGGSGGGNMQVAQALGAGQPNMQQLMGLASDPWASDSQKSIINSLLGQQMQQQDPMYQLQMQAAQQGLTKGDLEIQQMLNPPAPAPEWQTETTDSGDILRWNDNDPNAAPSVFYDAPDAPAPELTDTQINLAWRAEQAGLQPGTPEYAEFMRSGGQSTGMALSVGPDGTVQFAQGAGAGSRPLTESQSKLTLFQTLQTETQPVLLDLEKQFNPGNLQDAAARSTPIAGNFFQSEQGQIYNSAATAWAEGALRIATGAAATPEEMERTKRAYFAQPGDTPNTIAFKAQMREMYNRAINNSLGQPGEGALPIPSEFAQQVGTSGQGPVANQSQARPITTEAEYNALPAGAVYMDPTGQIRTKR